jgi:heme-degrading monooxygenase HmoA
MAYTFVRHTVEDYDRWKVEFDKHASVRGPAGSQGGMLFRGANNEVVVILQWSSMEAAQAFAQSDNLREVMQKAGVNSVPTVFFVEKVEDVPI